MKNAIIILLCAFALVGCKKYEGDFTLRTPESRLEGTWTVSDYGCADPNYTEIEFQDDGDVVFLDDLEANGRWEFNGDKSILTLEFQKDGFRQKDYLDISILTTSELTGTISNIWNNDGGELECDDPVFRMTKN